MTPTSIIIPAAGSATRMKSQGAKCLIKLSDETVLARLVRQLQGRWPEIPIFVTVGFQEKRLRRAVRYLRQVYLLDNPAYLTTNVAHSLDLAFFACPPGPALVVYGDLVMSDQVIPQLSLGKNSVLYGELSQGRSTEVGLCTNQGQVTHMSHELPIKWSQLALLHDRERAAFSRVMGETPGARNFLAYEILNRMIEQDYYFSFERLPGWLVEIDTSKDIEGARMAVHLERQRCE